MAKLTNHFQWTRLTTSSTDKHYSLDSEDDFRPSCRNVSHKQYFFSELPHPEDHYELFSKEDEKKLYAISIGIYAYEYLTISYSFHN